MIVAFAVFMIARSFIEDPPADEVKVCPFCKEPNAVDTSKCKACASEI